MTERETCPQCMARLLVQHPHRTTRDYVAMAPEWDARAVKAALSRLKETGYATNRPQAGNPGRGQWRASLWAPTPILIQMTRRGERVVLGRTPRGVDALEDDGWTPQPYVNPIRARALGMLR